MKYSFTDNLLLILADFFDFNQKFLSWQTTLAMAGDPRLNKNRKLIEKFIKDKRAKRKLYQSTQMLKRRGYLAEKIFNNSRAYFLTPKAKIKIFKIKSEGLKKKKLPKGRWLIAFFDIPESRRKERNFLRSVLINLGFEQLQKSVWISPYDASNLLEEFIQKCNLKEFVKILSVDELIKS